MECIIFILFRAAGMWVNNKFAQKQQYNYITVEENTKNKNKLVNFLLKFTPLTWTTYNWDIFGSFKRWFQTVLLVVVFEINELCSFMLKTGLWIPAPVYIILYILALV